MNRRDYLQNAIVEQARRNRQALRMYRPFPQSEEFHRADILERLVRGGNRSSKTTTCAVEFAHAATGIPIFDRHGNQIPDKYDRTRPLELWTVGYDSRHIGMTIYGKLFKPGAFDVIEDEKTGMLRVWRPWDPADMARKDEKQLAPPLIPPEIIDHKGWAWDVKSECIFTTCRLINGNVIRAWSSKGAAAQGQAVDVIWIDEDIDCPHHVQEWRIRLADREGKLFWSAWPHSENDALVDMSQRAEAHADEPDPAIREYRFTFSGNPFISDKAKRELLAGMSDEERRSRDLGEFRTDSVLVYPTFNIKTLHGVHSSGCPEKLRNALTECNYRPPNSWTHYLVLDPGHTQPAVLLGAVPPPEFGHYAVVWDVVYESCVDASQLAKIVKQKVRNVALHEMIWDSHAARMSAMGFGRSFGSIYTDEFRKAGITLKDGSTFFLPGSDNKSSRNMLVREWLAPRQDGTPTLLLVEHTTGPMQDEFRRYRKKIIRNTVVDETTNRDDHLMDCLAYWVSRDPQFVRGASEPTVLDPRYKQMMKWLGRDTRGGGKFYAGAGAAPGKFG